MTTHFLPLAGVIVVPARLSGPAGVRTRRFAVDTGASYTVVSTSLLRNLGYEDDGLSREIVLASMTGTHSATRCVVTELAALGHRARSLEVVAHELPHGLPFVGLLGLDFLRAGRLCIDFSRGEIDLTVQPNRV